jgi:hypothetical protein
MARKGIRASASMWSCVSTSQAKISILGLGTLNKNNVKLKSENLHECLSLATGGT